MRTLLIVAILALAAFPVSGQEKPGDAKKPAEPAKQAVPLDLSYKTRTGEQLTYDGEITVKSGYGDYQLLYTLETRTLKPTKDGGQQIAMTIHRWKELTRFQKEKTVFDSGQPAPLHEDGEYAALRKMIGKTLCVANIAPTGEMSRLLFSEEGDELWKKEGSDSLGRARDLLKTVLPLLPGKVSKVGDSWSEERRPAGEQLQFAFKLNHKLTKFDAESGSATFELAGKPERGASDLNVTKSEMHDTTAIGVFDCVRGHLRSYDLVGGCFAKTGEGEIASQTTFDFTCRVKVR